MNKIAADFLETDCEEMLLVDCDIRFTSLDVQRIFEHDEPLVFGIYPKKEDGEPKPCLCTFEEGAREYKGALKEIRRAGRGFMRVHRRVFEAMKTSSGGCALKYDNHRRDEWNFFESGVVEGGFSMMPPGEREYLTEDWYFCERARQLGFKVLVDTRIILAHDGFKTYRFSSQSLKQNGE